MRIFINGIMWVNLIMVLTTCGNPATTPLPIFNPHIYYSNKSGADLLNLQTPGSFDKNEIKVTDLVSVNGNQVERPATICGRRPDCAYYGCPPDPDNNVNFVQFCFHINGECNKTLIHLSPTIVDTLSYEIVPSPGYFVVMKIIYKGNTIWSKNPNDYDYGEPNITIVR